MTERRKIEPRCEKVEDVDTGAGEVKGFKWGSIWSAVLDKGSVGE